MTNDHEQLDDIHLALTLAGPWLALLRKRCPLTPEELGRVDVAATAVSRGVALAEEQLRGLEGAVRPSAN